MAVTAQNLINKSLRLLGVLASGETTTADEAQDSLYSLNSIIDSFSANPQYYFCTQAEQFTLVAGQNTYTIGNDPAIVSCRQILLRLGPSVLSGRSFVWTTSIRR
jgi:hypothetical protein